VLRLFGEGISQNFGGWHRERPLAREDACDDNSKPTLARLLAYPLLGLTILCIPAGAVGNPGQKLESRGGLLPSPGPSNAPALLPAYRSVDAAHLQAWPLLRNSVDPI